MKKKLTAYMLMLLMFCMTLMSGCGGTGEEVQGTDEGTSEVVTIDEDGWYYSTEDVALYLYTYGELPDNFITRPAARRRRLYRMRRKLRRWFPRRRTYRFLR